VAKKKPRLLLRPLRLLLRLRPLLLRPLRLLLPPLRLLPLRLLLRLPSNRVYATLGTASAVAKENRPSGRFSFVCFFDYADSGTNSSQSNPSSCVAT
jgi:hypothetical protein